MTPIVESALGYLKRGWWVTPVTGKAPILKDWPTRSLGAEDIDTLFRPEHNVGVVLGPSGLADLDFDDPAALAALRALAPPELEGAAAFQHAGRPHLIVRSVGVQTERFKREDGSVLLELRGDGAQTVFPPSVHPDGKPYEWVQECEPCAIDADRLRTLAVMIATVALAPEGWSPGNRHDIALALAGFLARRLDEGDALAVVRASAMVAGDEELRDRERAVVSSLRRVREGQPVAGLPTLRHVAPKISEPLAAWWASEDLRDATDEDDDPKETDLGNAVRLARRHGRDVRYCFTTRTFHVWTGSHWPPDDTGEVYRRAKETVRSIFREAEAASSVDESRQLAQHAVRSQAEPRIAAMVRLLRSEPGIPITPGQLDADPWSLNVLNGTLDLRSGDIRPHRREDLNTKIARVRYDRDAACPLWLGFLDRIMQGNERLIRFLQKAAGYSLTGDVSEQSVFFLHGTGANGKSTFLSVVLDVLGDYGKQAAPGLLTTKRSDSHPTELADLAGARFVASVEVDEGRRLAEALTKWLTGGDRVKARFMRQDFFEFVPTHKLWLAANHKPAIVGTDNAIWRRLRLVPFTEAIPEPQQDRLLGNKLRRELPGILNWALEGCLLWCQEGLAPPEEVTIATRTYRDEQDTLAGFLQDCCQTGDEKKVTTKDLYADYRRWCDDNGETALSQKALATRLAERGFSGGHRGTNGQRWWRGLGLVTHQGLDLDTSDA
jgi:P4 family phage/plasmid primase-like protien